MTYSSSEAMNNYWSCNMF